MQIKSLDEVINRLQYKADNIKAKLEPSYFTECIEYLKSLPLCDNGWIPCSVKMPNEPEIGMLDIKCLQEYNVMIEGADEATTLYYAGDGEWYDFITGIFYKVIAWQPLPPYQPKICINTDCCYNQKSECPASEGCPGFEEA